MKAALVILVFAAAVSAEVVTTYDSRTNGVPFSARVQSVDIGVTDPQKNPDFQLWLRNIAAPALADLDTQIIVPITGTLQNARADIQRIDDARRPAKREFEAFLNGKTAKEFKQDVRKAFRNARTNAAFTVAQRNVLSNLLWAVEAQDDFADLRDAKRAEDSEIKGAK